MKRRSVLVVEDHPELRRVLGECVQQLGWEPVEAPDGRAAMNVLAQAAPDLVCVDVVLPESSGYEVCEFIRRSPHLRQVPILMMSGRGLPDEAAFAEEAGADAFLSKPFSHRDFVERLRGLIGRRDGGKGDGER